jgi:hypothetical protein
MKKRIAKLKIGSSLIFAADYYKGDPMELVPNPNPDGYNKMITRKAARNWLEFNGPSKQTFKKDITKEQYVNIK